MNDGGCTKSAIPPWMDGKNHLLMPGGQERPVREILENAQSVMMDIEKQLCDLEARINPRGPIAEEVNHDGKVPPRAVKVQANLLMASLNQTNEHLARILKSI